MADSEWLVRLSDGPEGRLKGQLISCRGEADDWGDDEIHPNYAHVRFVGEPQSSTGVYVVRHLETPALRSRYRLDIDNMPGGLKTLIEAGFLQIGLAAVIAAGWFIDDAEE